MITAGGNDSDRDSTVTITLTIPPILLTKISNVIERDNHESNLEDAIIFLLWKGVSRVEEEKSIKARSNSITLIKIIASESAREFSISLGALVSKSRINHIVSARQTAMYVARKMFNLSLVAIGDEFNRHHSTVLHSVSKAESNLKNPRDFDRVQAIASRVRDRTHILYVTS